MESALADGHRFLRSTSQDAAEEEERRRYSSICSSLLFTHPLIAFLSLETGSVDTGTTDVWYHFKEGYTNAVRRNVKIADFV